MNNFRVASFNVFNLVSEGVDFYRTRSAYSHADYLEKTAWIGRQLDEMQVDIVGFQEVFHKAALEDALSNSKRFADVKPIVLATKEDDDPIRTPAVGLAGRFDLIGRAESISAIPEDATLSVPAGSVAADADAESEVVSVPITSFSRPILKATLQVNEDIYVTMFVTHLKSKRPTLLEGEDQDSPIHRTVGIARSLIRRAAEAAGLRSLIISEVQDNHKPVIVVGDVNDGTLAITTQMIAGEQPFFKLKKELKEPFRDVLLYTAQQIQARESTRDTYFTHIFNGSYEALDHIMVSEEFYGSNPDRVGEVDYVQVFNDHILDEMASRNEIPRTRSDHGQVVAKIRLRDQ